MEKHGIALQLSQEMEEHCIFLLQDEDLLAGLIFMQQQKTGEADGAMSEIWDQKLILQHACTSSTGLKYMYMIVRVTIENKMVTTFNCIICMCPECDLLVATCTL